MKSRVFGVALAGLLAIGLAGCSTPAPAASPSPTPPFASADAAYKAAEATYRGYVDALNRVNLEDPKTFEPVYGWTAGDAQDADKKSLTGMSADHVTSTGAYEFSDFRGQDWDARTGDVWAYLCLDVSHVVFSDMKDATPAPPQPFRVDFVPSSTPTGLSIVSSTPTEKATCGASR